jgi:hypothetical protein
MQTPRMYHSTALLLPDARVLVAGGGRLGTATPYLNAEIYSPAYLFKGGRPTGGSAPSAVAVGSSFFVGTPDAASVASVALVRSGAVTHSINMNQRFVPLGFEQAAGGLTVHAPADAATAPPGDYMLFLVDANGVPSVAPFVRVDPAPADVRPPSAPGNLAAAGGVGNAALSWTASSDDVGVARYNVYRSAVDGFTPAAADRVAQVASLSHVDSGVPAGTSYYVVTAVDAAGNESAPSEQRSVVVTADQAAPSVAVTSPAAGTTVSGSVTLAADASDDVAVAGVQFFVDGVAVGAEDVSAPFGALWNAAGAANGSHTVHARARDAAGNVTTSAPVAVTVANPATVPNLVAAYSFDEGTGTALGDGSGNGNNGFISGGARWTTGGRLGSALVFDGTSGMVTIPDSNSLDLTNGMTLEAWIKPAVAATDYSTVLLKERVSSLSYGLYASGEASAPASAYINRSGTDYAAQGGTSLPAGAWTFLAGTYDGSTIRLYRNGTLVASRSVAGTITTSNSPLRIGGNSVWGEWFNGVIDEVRVYKAALTATQIQSDMQRVGPEPVPATPPASTSTTEPLRLTDTATASLSTDGSLTF